MAVTSPHFVPAHVMHKRMLPRMHMFTYGVFYLCFPLGQIAGLKNPFLSIDCWNLLSFYNRDHGPRDGSSLETWIQKILRENGCAVCNGAIVLLTLPRFLGYIFNPVSFWFCHDAAGGLRAILSEVNNTFGESHCYLSHHDDFSPIAGEDWFDARKVFHVSPFLDVAGDYKFRFALSDDRIAINVNLFKGGILQLATSVTGRPLPVSMRQTVRLAVFYPFVTLKTVFLIHFEALRLWLKGMKYHPKPPPPAQEISR